MNAKRRSWLLFALAAGLMLAAVPAGYLLFLRRPAAPPLPLTSVPDAGVGSLARAEPSPPPAPVVEELRIAQLEGTVEVRRGHGEFVPASAGLALRAEDAVRTGMGWALLSAGTSYEVRVEPGSLVEIETLTERLSRFGLGVGMLSGHVDLAAGRELVVRAAGSDAIASTRGGAFAISNDARGTVAVGARAGEVEFRAAGKAVVLRSGEQSISQGGAPSTPAPIPSSLFLKVDWPQEQQELNSRRLTVAGRIAPGAVLVVEGRPIIVDREGRFRETLKLREGRNVISAEAFDVGRNRWHRETEVRVDTTAPESDISTQKLWEN